MKSIRTGLTILLALLWLPATSFCLVERAGLLEQKCCSEEATPAPPGLPEGDSPCCSLASPTYKANEFDSQLIPALLLDSTPEVPQTTAAGPEPPLVIEALAAPELLISWHFFCRAAGLARAPTLLS